VDEDQRDAYLTTCVDVVEQARRTTGCLDFTITADLLDPTRINILERWESREDVEAFRGGGPSDDQGAMIRGADVSEYDISRSRSLTG
jgi:heme-degrading monooxygenase HmoA